MQNRLLLKFPEDLKLINSDDFVKLNLSYQSSSRKVKLVTNGKIEEIIKKGKKFFYFKKKLRMIGPML